MLSPRNMSILRTMAMTTGVANLLAKPVRVRSGPFPCFRSLEEHLRKCMLNARPIFVVAKIKLRNAWVMIASQFAPSYIRIGEFIPELPADRQSQVGRRTGRRPPFVAVVTDFDGALSPWSRNAAPEPSIFWIV